MQVDFYIIGANAPDATFRTACRVAEKAWQMGHRVYIHTDSPRTAAAMDDLLWTFRQESFVPHGLHGDTRDPGDLAATPVLIGSGDAPDMDLDVLINLAEAVPLFIERSRRIAEIVGAGEDERRAGRERYRNYRDRGFDIRQHDI